MLHLGPCCPQLSPELVRFSDDLETEQILLLVIRVLWFQARIAGAVLGADGMTRSSPRCFTEPDPWMPAECTASGWKSISKNQHIQQAFQMVCFLLHAGVIP
ncbi:hypothetical protein CHARACLAT_020596 [Characodon lateralis]|uniref:Uncharacterized protein n=1 Tax=Characodon lateralis TaxID=208331 RepID=A0ABU7DAV9_9TELE|nr:hypothetical protein [Characodon lateralis]